MKEQETRAAMAKEARQTKGGAVGIPPRHMHFPYPDDMAKYPFFDGNVLASSLFSVMSAIFPPGERFFVESVRRFRKQIDDETLKAKVSGFIGQESLHGNEHEALNQWFQSQGYDIAMADRMIRISLGMLEKLPASQQAACTNFMEHFTALLAEQWLTHTGFRESSDAEAIKLWSWHALEELEHKDVVFDVHASISRHPYPERVLAGPLVVGALLPGILFSWVWITARHPERFAWREHRRGLKAMVGRKGFFNRIFAHVPDYFAHDFHPNNRDTRQLEETWRQRFFGDEGELNAYWYQRKRKKAV